MYAWKCWRETRARFVLFLSMAATLCALGAVGGAAKIDRVTRLGVVVRSTPRPVSQIWADGTTLAVGGWGTFITLCAAFGLGASGVGEEFRQHTLEFLLTLPRRRRFFVWTGWFVGVCQLLLLASLGAVSTFGTLVYLTGRVYTWRVLAAALPLLTGGAVLYGLTYFMTVLTRSGRSGLSYSLGVSLIYLLLPVAADRLWQIHVPSLSQLMASCEWVTSCSIAFPATRLAGWALVGLAFPIGAQLLVENADV